MALASRPSAALPLGSAGFVPFSPLGGGFLTGKIGETTKFDPTDFRNSEDTCPLQARSAKSCAIRPFAAVNRFQC
uniref:hypothetical protein n=1 Tax=Neorhizobium sp. EC2-8 TaxID=3129230 RepID=UPI003100C074